MAATERYTIQFEVRQVSGFPVTLISPTTRPPKRGFPGLVLLHGLGGNQDQTIKHAVRFAEAGFVVACMDAGLHGFDQSEDINALGQQDRPGMYLKIISRTLPNLKKVRAHLARRQEVDGKRLALGGYSMGGMIAFAAIASGIKFRAMYVSISTGDVIGINRSKMATITPAIEASCQALIPYSIHEQPHQLKNLPICLTAGELDQTVKTSFARKTYAFLRHQYGKDADKRLHYFEEEKAEHWVTLLMDTVHIDWLKRWCV